MCGYIYRPCIASTIRMCIYLVNYYKCSFLTCWLCSVYCLRSKENKGFFYSLIIEKVTLFACRCFACYMVQPSRVPEGKGSPVVQCKKASFPPPLLFSQTNKTRGGKGSLANALPWSHRRGGETFFPSGDQSPFTARGRICRLSTRGEFIHAANSHG